MIWCVDEYNYYCKVSFCICAEWLGCEETILLIPRTISAQRHSGRLSDDTGVTILCHCSVASEDVSETVRIDSSVLGVRLRIERLSLRGDVVNGPPP